ncbi:CAP domain-containing protein [Synoicihabitans lomoniglobus]|uniref:CAP domain-containing protein n=1 Tax=Synoicihabitans lomoniglobus TaxID=2909285 RepID=A0AAF0CN29_9BACT|nr:CAP domain-containing protein [Opitutaceae bacterium LMO-M01]WED64953.1 CAP domain-containing protein [Opitutaceae bacterium LMO-M01]
MSSRLPFRILVLALPALLAAQPTAPTPADIDRLGAMSEINPKVQADGEPWTMDTGSREESRQFYRAIYGVSEGVPSGWDGDTASGTPGTTTAAFKEAVRNRVNFYRAFAGLSGNVSMNAQYSAKAQQAALMMSANSALSHNPPSSWTHFTTEGAEAAGASNLGIGTFGPETMDGYMRDHGPGNTQVGHRRWILYPQTREMGTGDVETQGSFAPANALWVQDSRTFDARPTTRDNFVAWPPKGNVPYQLVWPRWSFSLNNADFSAATVSMTRDGSPISTTIDAATGGGGAPEPTLIWRYDGLSGDLLTSHDRPTADTSYVVSINNVSVNGSAQNFSYTVNVFDPDVAGDDSSTPTISGSSTPSTGQATPYAVNLPSFASGLQWRELGTDSNGSIGYGAEEINSHPEIDGTSDSYSLWVTGVAATGNGAFYLAHPEPSTQSFQLPGTYLVPPNGAGTLAFNSRLGFATATQVARAEVSTNDGQQWTAVYEKAGNGSNSSPTESSYQNQSISLAAYAGQAVQVRFSYRHEGGSFFSQTDTSSGWLVDDIRMTGLMAVTATSTSAHITGSNFDYTPSAPGIKILQARGMFFGNYGMDWGPAFTAFAQEGGGDPTGDSRIVNLSVRANAASGNDTLNVGMVVGGTGTKPLLMRVVGPTLTDARFNLTGVAPNPALQVFTEGAITASNDNWDASLINTFNSVGAFALVDGSADAALVTNLSVGPPHPAIVNTQGNNGLVIVEAYDLEDPAVGTARLVNVSARNQVGTGSNVLVAGFVIGGTGSKTLLIRGVGATLADSRFNLTGVLADPQIIIRPLGSDEIVASNDNWNNDANIAAVSQTVGAFSLSSNADAAVLVTLAPGGYTATVSGVNDTTGIAIVEVYEVE